MTDVNSQDIRCFQNRAGSSTATVAAGDKLGFVAMSAVTHFGPVSFYMARVPEGKDINTWDGAGNVWFKVGEISAVSGAGGLTSGEATWPAYSMFSPLSPPFPETALTPPKTRSPSNSPSPRVSPAASTSSASRASPCTRRRTSGAPRSTWHAGKSRSRAAAMALPARWSLFLARTSRATRACCGRTTPCGRATRRLGRMCGRGRQSFGVG